MSDTFKFLNSEDKAQSLLQDHINRLTSQDADETSSSIYGDNSSDTSSGSTGSSSGGTPTPVKSQNPVAVEQGESQSDNDILRSMMPGGGSGGFTVDNLSDGARSRMLSYTPAQRQRLINSGGAAVVNSNDGYRPSGPAYEMYRRAADEDQAS